METTAFRSMRCDAMRMLVCVLLACLSGCTFPLHKVPAGALGQRILEAPPPPSVPDPNMPAQNNKSQADKAPDAAALTTGAEGAPEAGGRQPRPLDAAAVCAPIPPDQALTLEQATAFARKSNPRLRVLREQVNQAKAGKEIAFSAFLPEAAISYRAIWGSENFGLPTAPSLVGNMSFGQAADMFQSSELNLQWAVWDFGVTPGRYRQSQAAEKIAELQYSRGLQTVTYNTTAAYFNLLEQEAFYKIAVEAVRRADSFLRDARNYLDQGTAVRDDVLQAELLVAEMQLDLVRFRAARTVALAGLNRVMGLHVASSTRIEDQTLEPGFGLSLSQCLQMAVDNRDEFKSVQKAISSSQWGLSATQAKFLPRVLAGATGANHQGQGANEANFLAGGVKIELALFEGGRRCGELRDSRAEVRVAVARAEEVADGIAFEVIAAHAGIDEARERISFARTAVARGEENLRVLLNMFQNGDASSTDVVDAQWALLRAQETYAAAVYQYQTALAQMDYAVGAPVSVE